jgi:hypothetical protein
MTNIFYLGEQTTIPERDGSALKGRLGPRAPSVMGMGLFRRVQQPKRHGYDARQDKNRPRSDDEIEVTASVGGHEQPERHED